ncbi:hypothetical protein J7J26_03675 [Candidatus Micrarchaeota archaeon]|nr:hypothetical protein [Candidatus Micrarchaeota archaeon]
MEIKFTKKGDDLYEIEFIGIDLSVVNYINEKLVNNVKFSASLKEHPVVAEPKLIIKTEKDPKKLIHEAIKDIIKELDKLEASIK